MERDIILRVRILRRPGTLGAAGSGISALLLLYGVRRVLGFDRDESARALLRARGGEPASSLDDLLARAVAAAAIASGVAGERGFDPATAIPPLAPRR